jgi:prefoldin subunit 5
VLYAGLAKSVKVGLGKVFKPLFAKRHREKMSPGTERSALEGFNEKVEYVRSLIQRMGYEGYVSDKLEYEIARAVAKRLSALADFDLREIINEIFDNIDKSLNIGENLRIVESILSKYASNTYDSEYIESMYEAYQRWLENHAQEPRERAEPRGHYAEGWKGVLTVSASAGRAKRKRAEAKDMAELRELMAKVSELASALSKISAKLNELSKSSTELAELTKELRVMKASIEEVRASHALVMGSLREIESTVKRLERELKELKDGVERAEPGRARERVGVRVDNRVARAEPGRARERAQRLRLTPREARVRLGGFEVAIDFRKAAKRILYL